MRACWLALFLVLGAPSASLGAPVRKAGEAATPRVMYHYRDDHGTRCYTDRLQAVPARYRANVEKVPLPPRAPPASPRAPVVKAPASPAPAPPGRAPESAASVAAGPDPGPPGPHGPLSAVWSRHGAALAIVLLAPWLYRGLCILCGSMSSRQLSTAIRLLFTASIPLALVYLYSRELVRTYFQLKNNIVIFQENRGEQAERNVRALQRVAPE